MLKLWYLPIWNIFTFNRMLRAVWREINEASVANRTLPRIRYLEKRGDISKTPLVEITAAIFPYLLLFHRDDTITSRKFQWKRRERERDDRGRSGKKVVGPGVKNGFFVVDRGWPNFRQRKKKRFFLLLPSSSSLSSSSSSPTPRRLSRGAIWIIIEGIAWMRNEAEFLEFDFAWNNSDK